MEGVAALADSLQAAVGAGYNLVQVDAQNPGGEGQLLGVFVRDVGEKLAAQVCLPLCVLPLLLQLLPPFYSGTGLFQLVEGSLVCVLQHRQLRLNVAAFGLELGQPSLSLLLGAGKPPSDFFHLGFQPGQLLLPRLNGGSQPVDLLLA